MYCLFSHLTLVSADLHNTTLSLHDPSTLCGTAGFLGTLHVGGKHEHAARLLVPTTVLSPFPPSRVTQMRAYATSISIIHPLSMGDACLCPPSLGDAGLISTLLGWRMFISTLLGWRICLAYATLGSPQGYTGMLVLWRRRRLYRFIWRWHRHMSLTHQWIGVVWPACLVPQHPPTNANYRVLSVWGVNKD